MPIRIEIVSEVPDMRAKTRFSKLTSYSFGKKIKDIQHADVYTIDKSLTTSQKEKIATMLVNPVTQKGYTNAYIPSHQFDWVIETGFLPGVTDNVATTVKEMIQDLLKTSFNTAEGVYTSQLTFITGHLTQKEVELISQTLINPVVERVHIKSFAEFKKNHGMGLVIPQVKLQKQVAVLEIDLDLPEAKLIDLGKKGIVNPDGSRRGPLALDLDYLKTIRGYFKKLKRNPTDVELESIAQTWSEHCKHTIFANPMDEVKKGLYDTYIKGATEKIRKQMGKKDFCVSVFTDNSGAIEFDKKYLITHKVETHNSPSALDPFGGAVTGIVGVNRDTLGFGLGAKPVANTYGFCFGPPDTESHLYRDEKRTQPLLSPRRILDGVVAGVNSGGNCSGIPTPQGFMFFDPRYRGKPLVFVGTVGLIPKKSSVRHPELVSGSSYKANEMLKRVQHDMILYKKKAKPGDYIVMIGGRVGLDGIHGATFSSEALNSGSPATAVQIGDPITQKKLSDALVKEARDLGLYHSITDNGAGGLSCSVAEMAKETGGCLVQLEKVPLKYPGLAPWQIWISESQERMTLAVPKNKWAAFKKLMMSRGVEATMIGEFTKEKKCVVMYNGKKIMDLDMRFLHEGLPSRQLQTTPMTQKIRSPKLPKFSNLNSYFLKMLERLNIASFEFISRQYDHEVQATSVIKPLQGRGRINGETSVVRPVLSSQKGIILSQGLYPAYSEIDPYRMAICSIDTAVRNIVAAGGDPSQIALLDNFCWCSSQESGRLWQLKQTAKGCFDIALAYQTPFISGKDSMFNDFKGFNKNGKSIKISVPPTLLVSSIAIIDDVQETVSIDLKFPGDLIYVLGETHDELGGSEYFFELSNEDLTQVGDTVPQVSFAKNRKLYQQFYTSIQKGLVASAISVNRGGLGVALAKSAMSGMYGMDVSFKNVPGNTTRDDFALFSESQGRLVATIAPQNKVAFERTIRGISFTHVGTVIQKPNIIIFGKKGKIVNLNLNEVLKTYKGTFKNF